MKRFLPYALRDLVPEQATAVVPTLETGPVFYRKGRGVALPSTGALLDLRADRAKNGTHPGNNADPTTTWADVSGSANHGTLTGYSFSAGSGWESGGLRGDGSDDYVILPAIGAAGDWTFTYEVWASWTMQVGTQVLLSEGRTTDITNFASLFIGHVSGIWYVRANARDGVAAIVLTPADAQSALPAPDGQPRHFALTGDGTTMTVYFDGQAVGWATLPAGFPTLNRTTVGALGRSTYTVPLNGTIFAARIYSTCLSPGTIRAHRDIGHASQDLSIVYPGYVVLSNAGVAAQSGRHAYYRSENGVYRGPCIVSPSEKSGAWQAAVVGAWSDPLRLFLKFMAPGDLLIPFATDSVGYVKL